MITKIKDILGITSQESDKILEFYINYTGDLIKSYCNLTEIPDGLQNTWIFLTAEIYKQSENKTKISMGDVSVEYGDSSIFREYKNILNKFRKVGFYGETL